MRFPGALKRARGSVRSHLGTIDKTTERVLSFAEELAFQATEQTDQYEETGDVEKLRRAINFLQQALNTISEDQRKPIFERDDYLGEFVHGISQDQCLAIRTLFFATGDAAYLHHCINQTKMLVAASPKPPRSLFFELCFLSRTLSYRYFALGEENESDRRDALDALRRASSVLQKERKKLDLSGAELTTFQEEKELLDKPIEIAKGIYLYNRAANFKRRFFHSGDLKALRSARSYFARALQLFPPAHPNYTKCAVSVADCEVNYVHGTNDIAGLQPALKVIDSLDVTGSSTDEFMDATHTKSLLYRTKYDFSSDPKDLEYSIAAAKAAVAISAKSRNLRMFALENLSSQLCRRAEAQRSSEDIDAAIVAARNALDVCSEERVQRAEAYANLGARLEMKYTLFGGSENLVAAIGHSRFAVTTLPENHRKRALHLHNLSNGLRLVFEDSGKAEVLDESIRVERNALKIAARDDPEKYIMLYGLSLSLEHRFRKTQNSQDMNEAMSAAEEALAGMPKGRQIRELFLADDAHSRWIEQGAVFFLGVTLYDVCSIETVLMNVLGSTRYPMCLHNLANVLHDRFMRSKAICDIDRAVKAASDAISSGSSDETGELVYSMTLSACLFSRHDISRDVADIDQAISVARGVIQKCSRSHPKRPHWLSELVLLLDRRFECSGSKEKHEYLDQALQFRKESVATLSEHHPDMAWFLCSLGSLQVKKNELLIDGANQRKPGFLLGAIASFRRGFNQANASPSSKICNGMLAGSCYMALGNWEPASEILSGSVQLLQQVSPLSLDDNDRQHQLRGLTGLSTEACVSYLMLGKVEAAAEILEAGRGIIANISTRQHEDHKALKSASLSLHTQYTELCQSLSLGSSAERDEGLDLVAKRNQDQASLERIEERIRRLPGLEHFNKRLSASQIRRLAERGPLVSYCTTESRAFALIVTTKSISSLPLPDLLWDDVERNTPLVTGDNRLSLRPPSKRSGANKKMRELLAWLWDTAVKPVLDHLGLIRSEGERLHPRLWWVTSGPLGVMPLHAAGKGSKFPQENTYAHVVSSYTATFSALAFARQCQSKVSRAQPKVALVTMPKTAARRDLNTAAEVQAVRDAFSTSGTGLVEMCQPAAADVLHQVRGGSIDVFHFSCHSEPDLNDPSKTSLLFGCDATATSPDRLPIQELRKFNGATDLSSRAPQLAYLSACCTAQQYDLKLLDENVHLAAVFQVMGFPSVIGTLWEADDIAAAFIAKAFYQELFQLRHVGEDNVVIVLREEIIARALYNTTAACRSAKFKRTLGVDDVLLWANFIHFRL